MFIKLEKKAETEKAYQLPNGAWIPKTALDGKGIEFPYFKIQDWWLAVCNKTRNNPETVKKLKGLLPLHLKQGLPKKVFDKYITYLEGGLQISYMYDSTDRRWEIPDYKSL